MQGMKRLIVAIVVAVALAASVLGAGTESAGAKETSFGSIGNS